MMRRSLTVEYLKIPQKLSTILLGLCMVLNIIRFDRYIRVLSSKKNIFNI